MPAAVLWGAGTAFGEIPPYAVAYHASVAGGKVSVMEESLAVSAYVLRKPRLRCSLAAGKDGHFNVPAARFLWNAHKVAILVLRTGSTPGRSLCAFHTCYQSHAFTVSISNVRQLGKQEVTACVVKASNFTSEPRFWTTPRPDGASHAPLVAGEGRARGRQRDSARHERHAVVDDGLHPHARLCGHPAAGGVAQRSL